MDWQNKKLTDQEQKMAIKETINSIGNEKSINSISYNLPHIWLPALKKNRNKRSLLKILVQVMINFFSYKWKYILRFCINFHMPECLIMQNINILWNILIRVTYYYCTEAYYYWRFYNDYIYRFVTEFNLADDEKW